MLTKKRNPGSPGRRARRYPLACGMRSGFSPKAPRWSEMIQRAGMRMALRKQERSRPCFRRWAARSHRRAPMSWAHAGQGEKASYGEKGGRLPDGTADCHSGHGFGAVMTGHDGVREIHADLGKLGDEDGQAYAQGAACLGFGEEKGHGSGRGIGGCWMRDCMAVCLTSVRWRRNRTRIGFSPLPTPAFPSPARKSGEGVFSFS